MVTEEQLEHISKAKMAIRLETSRSTLNTLDHAARTIGKKLQLELVST